MEYLKEYDITENQIQSLKEKYNSGIIEFVEQNKEFIKAKLDYLKEEKVVLLYEIIYNNIKLFLEELSELKRKMEIMKNQNISIKAINMILVEEELYDKI